jgi:hypothetical protein
MTRMIAIVGAGFVLAVYVAWNIGYDRALSDAPGLIEASEREAARYSEYLDAIVEGADFPEDNRAFCVDMIDRARDLIEGELAAEALAREPASR